MAPLFESGKMQVRVLPPQFCSVSVTEQLNYAPVAQLERGADLKNQTVLVQIQSGASTGCSATW